MIDQYSVRRSLIQVFLVLLTAGLSVLAVLYPLSNSLSAPVLAAGQVAAQDILAPATLSFESTLLTEQQRDAVARQVAAVYSPPDPSVARRQVGELRETLDYITAVRTDLYATLDLKLSDLAALEDIDLRQDIAQKILALNEPRWQTVQAEAVSVLEQVMRNAIREDRLEETRRSVPTRVSLAMPEDQANLVAELVSAFVAPNSLYSADLTEQARQQASAAVQPVTRSFVTGETIIQRGRVITALDLEALQALGLTAPDDLWKEQLAGVGLTILAMVYLLLYLRLRFNLYTELAGTFTVFSLFLIFLGSARLVIPGHIVLPYLFPLPAFSLIITVLFGTKIALVSVLPLAILTTFGLPNVFDLTLYYTISAIFGVLTVGYARRISAFFRASVAAAAGGAVVVLCYRLATSDTDAAGLATLAAAALFNGLASAGIAVLLQFILSQFLNLISPLQLIELARPDHPLLQFILRRAPGTYQHSLQVANLAEQAAERIHADAMLTRVGALYHDAGKALNPVMFIENQVVGSANPHDSLEPRESAAVIIAHVTEGLDLARKHRLPGRIRDFIAEHHGDALTRYQYVKALEAVGGDERLVDPAEFRYPGPKPRSRETAILMLADSSEAVTRARKPRSEDELRQIVKDVIDSRLDENQLDESNLTINDLAVILDSFVGTLKGIYHPRIEYPRLESPLAALKTSVPPALPAVSLEHAEPPSMPDTPTVPVEKFKSSPQESSS